MTLLFLKSDPDDAFAGECAASLDNPDADFGLISFTLEIAGGLCLYSLGLDVVCIRGLSGDIC